MYILLSERNKALAIKNANAILKPRQPDSCAAAYARGEESPGFRGTRHQITSGWENPRESATENIPPGQVSGKGEKAR